MLVHSESRCGLLSAGHFEDALQLKWILDKAEKINELTQYLKTQSQPLKYFQTRFLKHDPFSM
jgi:hypothetical protein